MGGNAEASAAGSCRRVGSPAVDGSGSGTGRAAGGGGVARAGVTARTLGVGGTSV